MARAPGPKAAVLRALLARSGNLCAFPNCTHLVVNAKNQFVAQVCHIEAAAPGGERYNPLSNDTERGAYENLVILCYAHHVETDDVDAFPSDRLREMKKEHEAQVAGRSFVPPESVVAAARQQLDAYWGQARRAATEEHP